MQARSWARVLAGLVALVSLVASCTGPGGPAPPPAIDASGAIPSQASSSPGHTASPTGSGEVTGFASAFAEAVDASREVPLAGLSSAEDAEPMCEAIGQEGPPAMFCMALIPADDPMVTLWAIAAGSVGGTGLLMAYAAMPDGIEGTRLVAPEMGDDALHSRTWSEQGCKAVLAVRDGTLIVSVQVRLDAHPATADCGLEAPTDYLEGAARTLVDSLGPFGAIGLPVNDPVARDRVVELITDGTLKPGERDLITLPPEFADLSDSGQVVAMRDGDEWTIVFFEVRGLVDNYSGWVFRSTSELGPDEDPLGGGHAVVERLDDHWFHVVAS